MNRFAKNNRSSSKLALTLLIITHLIKIDWFKLKVHTHKFRYWNEIRVVRIKRKDFETLSTKSNIIPI